MPTVHLYPEVKKELEKFKEENYCSTYSDTVYLLLERARMFNLTAQISSQLDKFAEIIALNKENPKADTKKEKANNLESDMNKPLQIDEISDEEIDLPDFDGDLD